MKDESIYVYVYLVVGNRMFYIEPDYELVKIFTSYRSAEKCLNKIKKSYKYNDVFIVKKRLFY